MDLAIPPVRQAPQNRDGHQQTSDSAVANLGWTIPRSRRETQSMDSILLDFVLGHLDHA